MTDLELIERMSLGNFDEKKSSEAFEEFHKRYAAGLYSMCSYICRMLPDRYEAAAEITENVLMRTFAYANSYNPNRASVKTWLNKIAQNEFNKYYVDYRKNHPIEEEPEDSLGGSDIEIEQEDSSFDKSKVNGDNLELALNELTEMERDILMTHMMYKDIDNLDSQIPDEVMRQLCVAYKKKPNTIRKIKSRALTKIKTFILRE